MLNRQVGWHLTPEDAIDIAGRASILILRIGPIRDQAADRRINTARIDGRESAPIRQCYDALAVSLRGRAQGHDQTTVRRTCEIGERPFELADIARMYARLVSEWVSGIGLDRLKFATHSMRRTKVTLIYRRTGNLRAAQLLLGHQKIESTARYLGVEIDDALEIAEKIEV